MKVSERHVFGASERSEKGKRCEEGERIEEVRERRNESALNLDHELTLYKDEED